MSYFKGAYGMVLLREQILGKERFDWAFRKYIRQTGPTSILPLLTSSASYPSEGGEDLSGSGAAGI